MADRVHPASKPTPNGNGAAANGAATTANGTANPGAATKPVAPRAAPYRPPPQYHNQRRRRGRSGRGICCCCCFWSILIIVALALLAAIAGAAVYVLYRPHRPQFTVTSLRVARLNLTAAAADSSSSHLAALANLTVAAKNPNSHFTFFYDAFAVTLLSGDSVPIANGSFPAFFSDNKNETTLRAVAAAARDLDTEATTSLRSDLRRRTGVPLRIEMDTKVRVKMESLKSKKVGIRVTCDGIKAVAPKGKSPTVASLAEVKCKVDLRIKIWKWTF